MEQLIAASESQVPSMLQTSVRFDCILLDIMMVRTNGVDVAVALRKAFAGSDTPLPPLIAMTANSSPADVAVCVGSWL